MLMRVLTTGRVLTAAALVSASAVATLALPAFAGTPAPVVVHAGAGTTVTAYAGQAPAREVARRPIGVALGPAVKYVREPDGTVRRIR
jgi:hypothetical protein